MEFSRGSIDWIPTGPETGESELDSGSCKQYHPCARAAGVVALYCHSISLLINWSKMHVRKTSPFTGGKLKSKTEQLGTSLTDGMDILLNALFFKWLNSQTNLTNNLWESKNRTLEVPVQWVWVLLARAKIDLKLRFKVQSSNEWRIYIFNSSLVQWHLSSFDQLHKLIVTIGIFCRCRHFASCHIGLSAHRFVLASKSLSWKQRWRPLLPPWAEAAG